MKWKDFFYFSHTERQAVIVLIVLCILVFAAAWFIPDREASMANDSHFEKEYKAFMASLQDRQKKRQANHYTVYQKRTIKLIPFDPNTADSLTFLDLGLPPWMVKNILHYRAKGGKFKKPDSFKKVYGLTEEQYTTLLPYIQITEDFSSGDTVRLFAHREKRDSLSVFKYPTGTVVHLNSADTTELKKIPGIGSAIARMIVGYRKQLGGFYEVEQLQDINLTTDKIQDWFTVDERAIKRININKASIERLKAHPYINFYQAKAIIEFRKKKGRINSLKQFALYEEFTEKDFERLSHYIGFD